MSTTTRTPISYPKEIRRDFTQTEGIVFKDGTTVSSAEIWRFMTEEAPKRFPHLFDASVFNVHRISEDVHFFTGIKRNYLMLTLKDRLLKAHDRGVPIILVQGGQSMDLYYAAGAIPLRPGFVIQIARDMREGLDLKQADLRGQELLELGKNKISMEACNQIAAHAAIDNNVVPVDLVAPYLCLRCSDMAYLVESHRSGKIRRPLYLVDQPIDPIDKPWAVDLVAAELRKLAQKISELTGKGIIDEDIFNEIKLENRGRQLAREIAKMWWAADIPPTNSTDWFGTSGILMQANEFTADPVASIQILEQTKEEVKLRIQNGIKGQGLVDKPKRVFICGSCVGPGPLHIDKLGGVLVGRDDNWSCVTVDVEEKGDPYRNLAKAILSFPYEQPTEKRAEWTIEMVKKSRADGVIFMYNWGCNYQTAVARMVSDIIKEKTGLPTTFVEVGELGRAESMEQSENRIEAFIEMI